MLKNKDNSVICKTYKNREEMLPITTNRGADQHRVQCGQAKLVGTVHGVWSSTWFWRVATEPGT